MLKPFETFKLHIAKKLQSILCEEQLKGSFIEPSEEKGDLTYLCFSYKNSVDIAEKIKNNYLLDDYVTKVVNIGSYVNFYFNYQKLSEITLSAILSELKNYGCGEKKHKKVIIEHTSANPTGPLHIGRARNPIIGDTITRIFVFCGYDVETQYWVNDLGKQVVMLGYGVKNYGIEKSSDVKIDHIYVKYYQIVSELMSNNKNIENEINILIRLRENLAPETNFIDDICKNVLSGIVQSLEKINIKIDKFVYESEVVKSKIVNDVIEKLKYCKYAECDNGAYYLDFSTLNIPERMYFTRSDETSLYITRDIAYHIEKLQNCDLAINVLGEDHKLEALQLHHSLKLFGIKNTPENIFYSFVTLPTGKMSTRKGEVIYLDDLIDLAIEKAYLEVKKRRPNISDKKLKKISIAVAISALRYNIIKVQLEKSIEFNFEEALNFEGNSAPFIQYAYVRMCSILKKCKTFQTYYSELLKHKNEYKLIKLLAKMPTVIKDACDFRAPHIIANFAYELATQFNQFYRDCQVLTSDENLCATRLVLVQSTKISLENLMNLLGFEIIDEM